MDERHMEENEIDLEKLDLNTIAVRQIPPVLVEIQFCLKAILKLFLTKL